MYNGRVNLSGEGGWGPRRDGVAAAWPEHAPVGTYRRGPLVRSTGLGTLWLAASPDDERLLELEHYTHLVPYIQADPKGALMLDLSMVMSLRHRHLGCILGAGLMDGAPYVVRPHLLGRPLHSVLQLGPLPEDAAIGIAYALAEVLAYLAVEGPRPGSCSMGGFGPEDVFLGFDGSILLLGSGLARGRGGASAPLARDYLALQAVTQLILPNLERPIAEDASSWARALRVGYPDPCGLRGRSVGHLLRARFHAAIPGERAALGLPTLH